MASKWFHSKVGSDEKLGPVDTPELKAMARDGRLSPEDLIWKDGWPRWTPAWRTRGLFPAGGPPPLPKKNASAPPPLPARAHQERSRSRLIPTLPAWAYVAVGGGVVALPFIVMALIFGGRPERQAPPAPQTPPPASARAEAPRPPEPEPKPVPRPLSDRLVGVWSIHTKEADGSTSDALLRLASDGTAQMKVWGTQGGTATPAVLTSGRWSLSGEYLTTDLRDLGQSVAQVHSANDTALVMTDRDTRQTVKMSRLGEAHWRSVKAMTPAELQAAIAAEKRAALPPGVDDAELWARVQREYSAFSREEQVSFYRQLKEGQKYRQMEKYIRTQFGR